VYLHTENIFNTPKDVERCSGSLSAGLLASETSFWEGQFNLSVDASKVIMVPYLGTGATSDRGYPASELISIWI